MIRSATEGTPLVRTTEIDANVPVPITSAVIASEQNLASQFYKAGLIPTDVGMSGYITSAFNSTVGP